MLMSGSRVVGMRCFLRKLAILAVLLLLAEGTAIADGIDVLWLMTRIGGWETHPILSGAIMIGLMLVNYVLNVVIVGIPAARLLHIKIGSLLRDLVVFTLLAQISDRVGAVTGFLLSFLFVDLAGFGGEQAIKFGLVGGVALNFILSGLGVGLLALWYLRRRWGVEGRGVKAIVTAAALITNPGWVMIPWIISS